MRLEVLIFGAAAVAVRADRVVVSLRGRNTGDESATVAQVLDAIGEQHPALRFALPAARLAVNQTLATSGTSVRSSDELALIALVGGG